MGVMVSSAAARVPDAPLGGPFDGSCTRAGFDMADTSDERPSNTQMEPTRPTVLCDPVIAARGSFATLRDKTDENEQG